MKLDYNSINAFDIIQGRLNRLVDDIVSADKKHYDQSTEKEFLFLDDKNLIRIRIDTMEEINTSCRCHPEYETHRHTSTVEIPYDDILDEQEIEDIIAHGDNWSPDNSKLVSVMKEAARIAEIAAQKEKEAAKIKADAQREAQRIKDEEAKRKREVAELQRLKSLYE